MLFLDKRAASHSMVLWPLCVLIALGACRSYDPELLKSVPMEALDGGPATDTAKCGNGRVDDGELCDEAILSDLEGACPGECSDADPCEPQVLAGNHCQTQCAKVPITKPWNGDQCCPPGIGAAEDSDCGSCGDGIIGPLESCDPPDTCKTRDQCTQAGSCVLGGFTGEPASCTAECRVSLATDCADGDHCCPAGCDASNDNDCSSTCGDGEVQPAAGETCEPGDESLPCPENCDDGIACTNDLMVGSIENCNVQCANVEIQQPVNGDGCCPLGAHQVNDSDCLPVCGNEVRESGEACDPCPASCDDGDPCTIDTRSGNANSCDVVCEHAPISQPANGDACCPSGANATNDSDCVAACGNGVTEGSEQCDGGGLCGNQCQRLFHASLVHRYALDGTGTTAVDSVSESNGTVVNTSLSGGTVVLAGGTTNQHVNLPNALISALSDATVEVWLTWRGGNDWQRIFDFGNNSNGENQQGGSATSEWFVTPRNSSGHVGMVMNFTSSANDTSNDEILAGSSALSQNTLHQVVGVFDDGANTARLYVDGVLIDTASGIAGHLSQIDDKNVWIGRSNYNNDELKATVHEVRIYNQALATGDILSSFQAGPDPAP